MSQTFLNIQYFYNQQRIKNFCFFHQNKSPCAQTCEVNHRRQMRLPHLIPVLRWSLLRRSFLHHMLLQPELLRRDDHVFPDPLECGSELGTESIQVVVARVVTAYPGPNEEAVHLQGEDGTIQLIEYILMTQKVIMDWSLKAF